MADRILLESGDLVLLEDGASALLLESSTGGLTFQPAVIVGIGNSQPQVATDASLSLPAVTIAGTGSLPAVATGAVTLPAVRSSGAAAAPFDDAVPIPHVRVAWRPSQFTRVTNPGFETDTTGWSVAAGVNEAGASITRSTSAPYEGSACGRLVTTTAVGSGVHFDLGSDSYFPEATYGTMYAATVWLKRISGPRICKLVLGSEGDTSERDEAFIELADDWRPYRVVWSPRSSVITDAQLAIVTVTGEVLTVDIDKVSLYMPEGFSQVENGAFASGTTGWSTDTGVTITRATSDPYETGGAYAQVDTTGGSGSTDGVTYSLGTRTFVSGRTYRLRVVARTVSGNANIALRLGDIGTDSDSASVTLTSAWSVYSADWTPNAERTSVEIGLDEDSNGSGVFEIAHVEVYEAVDELGTDLGDFSFRRGSSFAGRSESPGTFSLQLTNIAGKYTPDNTASALSGAVTVGRAVLARADYNAHGFALFHGNIDNIEPLPFEAKASVTGKDALATLGNVDIRQGFSASRSYAAARKAAWSQAISLGQRTDPDDAFGSSRLSATAAGIEGTTFFDGTSSAQPLITYLDGLNAATGSVHFIEPHYEANRCWTYRTVDRAAITDTEAGITIDEDFADVRQFRLGYETIENRMRLAWRSYETIDLPYDVNFGGTATFIAKAADPSLSGTLYKGDVDGFGPYLHFTDERIGANESRTDEVQTRRVRVTRLGVNQPPMTTTVTERVYPDAFVPFDMDVGDERELVLDFGVPVADVTVRLFGGTAAASVYVDTLADPQRIQSRWWTSAADTVEFVGISGTPYLPLESQEITVEDEASVLEVGVNDGQTVIDYLPARGMASGLGDYHVWRYGRAKTRVEIRETERAFGRLFVLGITDHATLSLDRWYIDQMPALVRAVSMDVREGATRWETWWVFEELPTHTDWFTLDDSEKGLDDAVVLAY